jgi:hypothetical protein
MTKPKIDLGLGSLHEFAPSERTPAPPAQDRAERDAVDATAREHGFTKTSIPVAVPRRARRASGEQLHQINIRGPISVMARFVDYCDAERIAYWEALDRLLTERGR